MKPIGQIGRVWLHESNLFIRIPLRRGPSYTFLSTASSVIESHGKQFQPPCKFQLTHTHNVGANYHRDLASGFTNKVKYFNLGSEKHFRFYFSFRSISSINRSRQSTENHYSYQIHPTEDGKIASISSNGE